LLADQVTLVLAQHGGDSASPATPIAWNIDARTPSTTYNLPTSAVDSLIVAPDGSLVALASGHNTVVVSPAAGTSRVLPGAVTPLAFSADSRLLLAADGSQAQVWDLRTTGGTPRLFVAHRDHVLAAAFSSDDTRFATVGADGTAVVWNLADLSPVHSFTVGASQLTAVRFSPDNRTLLVVGADGGVLAFDLTGGRGVGAALTTTPDTDPALVQLACRLAGRGLTGDEWRTYLPDRAFQQVCP
jgi:WD40 repeat protein